MKTEQELNKTHIQLQKKNFIPKTVQDTEISLTMEAQTLIRNLEEIIEERKELEAIRSVDNGGARGEAGEGSRENEEAIRSVDNGGAQ
jgi:hypothetical protein